MNRFLRNTVAALFAVVAPIAAHASDLLDPDLTNYEKVSGVSGNLNSVGSDTLNNMMALWAQEFKALYPNVNIQVEGKGSSTAPPALIEGAAQLGPMSRMMKAEEIDKFEAKFGYKPTAVPVALDALAVFVNKDNPIDGLTLEEVDSIFSSTNKHGGSPINTWGELDLKGEWADRALSLYGRNSASGTYGFFKNVALSKGDFRSTVKEQPGSSAVVQGVASDLYGIGYSGIGYKTSGVKAIALSDDGGALFEPSFENCLSGDYPLARLLYVYVNKAPNQPFDPLTLEFIKFVHSRQGQEVVAKDGYYPLPAMAVDSFMSELEN
ncbi:PstS family phosphate ABC transporter substrate-binding protein [Cerasicoccus arenae]|uniref:Phosphate-binding protein n=1 Tax=Cerasicoccus arenae TaxID=424488 RepID=A0A8J3DCZ9_9BACT|nr:PstS family phosphate ABC transporter substrate-binding protein [Cerasicoccus arenae]MBK1857715.1 PstS family phosphate ABC transporter substrate-binding protein [Cerasicoccus arenae]GHB91209.1 phosphate-binding protein PstS [Cerasicoccus arenae]